MVEATAARGKHLLEYWDVLRRRRWVVYLAVATVSLVALVGSFLVTPLYRATVTLMIERQNPNILNVRDINTPDYSWAAYSDFYQTQYQVLSSDAVARKTVRRLGLAGHPLFAAGESSPGLLARLRALLPGTARRSERTPEDSATTVVQGALEIDPVRNSQLVRVSYVSPDPELAAKVANALADAYIAFNLESSFTASDQASDFLVNQIGTLKKEIAAIEDQLQQYGESKQIVSIDDSNNITMKALSDVSQRQTEARAVLAKKEAAYRAILATPAEGLPEVQESNLISRLKQDYATYEAEYSQKSRLFKDEWPEMQTLKARLDQAKERLEEETKHIAQQVTLAAEAEYRRALEEVRNLDALLDRQEKAAQRLRRDSVEFANLQSEVQKKRETLDKLITRQNEMALSTRLTELDATSTNVRIVDRARPPQGAFRPNKKLNLLLGLVLGLGLGVAMAFFLDYLDNTIASPADVERVVSLPVLAAVPHYGPPLLRRVRLREAPEETAASVDLVTQTDPKSASSEAYRELRTSILLSNAGHPPGRIIVTSSLPEEGKSSAAINLAVVLAQLGRRVLLVDTDLRRPRLHKVFECRNHRGTSTYLSGLEKDAASLVVRTRVENLDLLPSGPLPPNPSELLNSPLFAGFGKRFLEAKYDHVIYDSAPVLSVADPVIVASVVDAVLMVVRARKTPRESLRLAADKFGKAGIRPIGIVVNDLDLESRGYSRYHYHYYGGHAGPSAEPETGEDARIRDADSA